MPHANITVIEYDGKCAANFMANDPLKVGVELQKRVRMFAGDQSKPEDLLKVMRDPSVGMQDVIIDDGGHSMKQQLTTLRTLLPWVKPGGILIMEDLQSTYSWQDPNWHDNGKQATMMDCEFLSCVHM
jgi:cephalosporin hydroxylase